MKRNRLLSWVLSLVMALTVFSIPVSGFAESDGGAQAATTYCIGWYANGKIKTTSDGQTINYKDLKDSWFCVFAKQGDTWEPVESAKINWSISDTGVAAIGYTKPDKDEIERYCLAGGAKLNNRNSIFMVLKKGGTVTLTAQIFEDPAASKPAATVKVKVTATQSYMESKFKGYLNFFAMVAAYADYNDRSLNMCLPDVNTYNGERGKKPLITKQEIKLLNVKVKIGDSTYSPKLTNLEMDDYNIDLKFKKAALGTRVTITYTMGCVKKTEKRVISKWARPKVKAKTIVYDGKKHKASLTVKVGSYKLTKNKEFYVGSDTLKNVGKGEYGVWSDDNNSRYLFEENGTFKIIPKGTTVKKLQKAKKAIIVKWGKQSAKMSKSRINGYQIQLATNSKFTKNKKTVIVKGYKNTSKKVKKLKKKTKYFVRVRTYKKVGKTTYYSKWSKVKSCKTK